MKNKFVRVAVVGAFFTACTVIAANGSIEFHSHDMDGVENIIAYKTPTAGATHVFNDLATLGHPKYDPTIETKYTYSVARGFIDLDNERLIRTSDEDIEENNVLPDMQEEEVIPDIPEEIEESKPSVNIKPTIKREETHVEETYVEEPQVEDIPSDGDYSWVTPEIEYMAKCVMAEEGNQPWEGLVAVIDAILNMRDDPDYPDTIYGVINNPGVFSVVPNGMLSRANPTPRVYDAIKSQMEEFGGSRDNYDVLYFRTNRYHGFGTPLFRVGNVYFSGR